MEINEFRNQVRVAAMSSFDDFDDLDDLDDLDEPEELVEDKRYAVISNDFTDFTLQEEFEQCLAAELAGSYTLVGLERGEAFQYYVEVRYGFYAEDTDYTTLDRKFVSLCGLPYRRLKKEEISLLSQCYDKPWFDSNTWKLCAFSPQFTKALLFLMERGDISILAEYRYKQSVMRQAIFLMGHNKFKKEEFDRYKDHPDLGKWAAAVVNGTQDLAQSIYGKPYYEEVRSLLQKLEESKIKVPSEVADWKDYECLPSILQSVLGGHYDREFVERYKDNKPFIMKLYGKGIAKGEPYHSIFLYDCNRFGLASNGSMDREVIDAFYEGNLSEEDYKIVLALTSFGCEGQWKDWIRKDVIALEYEGRVFYTSYDMMACFPQLNAMNRVDGGYTDYVSSLRAWARSGELADDCVHFYCNQYPMIKNWLGNNYPRYDYVLGYLWEKGLVGALRSSYAQLFVRGAAHYFKYHTNYNLVLLGCIIFSFSHIFKGFKYDPSGGGTLEENDFIVVQGIPNAGMILIQDFVAGFDSLVSVLKRYDTASVSCRDKVITITVF